MNFTSYPNNTLSSNILSVGYDNIFAFGYLSDNSNPISFTNFRICLINLPKKASKSCNNIIITYLHGVGESSVFDYDNSVIAIDSSVFTYATPVFDYDTSVIANDNSVFTYATPVFDNDSSVIAIDSSVFIYATPVFDIVTKVFNIASTSLTSYFQHSFIIK